MSTPIPPYGLHIRAGADPDSLVGELRGDGWLAFELDRDIMDKQTFFRSIRRRLPVNPPFGDDEQSWNVLDDSLYSGLYDLTGDRVAIVWPSSELMSDADPREYTTAVEILTRIIFLLADPLASVGKTKRVLVLLTVPGLERRVRS